MKQLKPKTIWELRHSLTSFRISIEKQMERLHAVGECDTEGILCALYLDTQIALNRLEDKQDLTGGFSMTRYNLGQYPGKLKS